MDLKAKLNELETLAAELRREEREGIEAARAMNQKNRLVQAKLRAVDEEAGSVRQMVKAEEAQAKAEAEAKAKAEREAAEKAATKSEGE